MAKLSIIVPIYQVENYLSQCLVSIKQQSFKDFEVLLIDDGSMDNSAIICHKYVAQDSRFKYFYKDNGGLSSARNFGLDKAQGDYILFVDSDDFIAPETCKIAYEYAIKYSADIVSFNYYLLDEQTNKKSMFGRFHKVRHYDLTKTIEREKFAKDLYHKFHWDEVAWNKLYAKRLFANIGYPYRRFEDTFISISLFAKSSSIVFIPDILYYYRCNRKGSITTDSQKQGIDMERIDSFIFRDLQFYYLFPNLSLSKSVLFLDIKTLLKELFQHPNYDNHLAAINGLYRLGKSLSIKDIGIANFIKYRLRFAKPHLAHKLYSKKAST